MHPAFKIYEEATPELIEFLSSTVLGTNGAKYQHLDTETRIRQLENPLHLSLFRNKKIIANITFSRRGKNWYVRYFAFDKIFQGEGQNSKGSKKSSLLKNELRSFFQEKIDSGEVECFYAYIDPQNDKSHVAAKELGFKKSGEVFTQTFSRFKPKNSQRVELIVNEDEIIDVHTDKFSKETFYHQQTVRGKTYCLRNNQGMIVAIANASLFRWKIHRLPGRLGNLLVKTIPFIPYLNKFITPQKHEFVGVDHVWIAENNGVLVEELFNSILFHEKRKMIVWWTDQRIIKMSEKVRWGIMHALLKTTRVDTFFICKSLKYTNLSQFTICEDFS